LVWGKQSQKYFQPAELRLPNGTVHRRGAQNFPIASFHVYPQSGAKVYQQFNKLRYFIAHYYVIIVNCVPFAFVSRGKEGADASILSRH